MRRTLVLVVLLASCNLLPSSPPNESSEMTPAAGEGGTDSGASEGGGAGAIQAGLGGEAGATQAHAGDGPGEAGSGGEREPPMAFPDNLASPLPVFALTMKQGPAATDHRDFELFWVAEDGHVRHLARDGVVFQETDLGESTTVRPVALSRNDGQTDSFVARPEGGIVMRSFDAGAWRPERGVHSGPPLRSITAASYAFDELDLFGVDETGTLHHLRWRADNDGSADDALTANTGWSAWTPIDGIEISGDVAVVARLQDELRLFARNVDGALWSKVLSPAPNIEQDWLPHPGCPVGCPCDKLRDAPIVASQDGSRIDLVFVNQDDSVWHLASNMGNYSKWNCTELKVDATSGAHLKMNADGLPTLFRIGGESVHASAWSATAPNFGAWRTLSFEVNDLATAGTDRTLTHLFGRSIDGAIQYRVWETE